MTIQTISLFAYEIPMKKISLVRKGLIIEAILNTNEKRYGEVAPLPCWSFETINEAKKEAHQIASNLIGLPLSSIKSEIFSICTSPSVVFGFYSLLYPNEPIQALISGLILDLDDIQDILDQELIHCKLKAGKLTPEEVLKAMKAFQKDSILIHIDCNQKWTANQLEKFAMQLPSSLDYIEEPIANFAQLSTKFQTLPLAQDESLRQGIEATPYAKYYIIKPTLHNNFMSFIQKHSSKSILSSSFESLVGIKALCFLSKELKNTLPLGIDTLKCLENMPYLSKYSIANGSILIDPIELDYKKLKLLARFSL